MGKFTKIIILVVLLVITMAENQALANTDQIDLDTTVIVTRAAMLDVAKEIIPPGCIHSMTADYCMLPTAFDTRDEIVGLLRQGMSKQEVIDTLTDKYGERILAAPTKRGFNLLVWILPIVAIIIGAIFIAIIVRNWVARRKETEEYGETSTTVSRVDAQKVEDELKHWI